ncbi:P-type conjugative transfer protein TrbL [Tatumella sp. UCD-D_suzukii]|uniref:P-type conjugative transfer protein TrbL n=1 Tax=Tatumella sp. UCD-D_suzukii TaxID=1408192 RepID=UPI0004725AB2|nr:P-type conjugative transfer protein TrbL [Tatumella sp. UCD-D_suzukii]
MLNRASKFVTFAMFCCVISVVFIGQAHAANLADASGSMTGLMDLILKNASEWHDRLIGYAKTVFWSLAAIQLVITFFPLVFRQVDFGEIMGELIRFILVIGFFYALLVYSSEWASDIVDSFRQAGAHAANIDKALRPGDMFGLAIELANTIGDVDTWNPLTATLVALAGLVVLLCFAFIAAFMGLTIIESYFVINASVIFMGFGASQWTREYAIAIMRYAVSVGAKLFVLTLIVGIIISSAKEWQTAYNHDSASMWTMVGLGLTCAYLSKTIPEMVQGIISGTSMGNGSAIGSMAVMAMAASQIAVAASSLMKASTALETAAGGGKGGGSAGGLANSLSSSLSGGAPNSPPGGVDTGSAKSMTGGGAAPSGGSAPSGGAAPASSGPSRSGAAPSGSDSKSENKSSGAKSEGGKGDTNKGEGSEGVKKAADLAARAGGVLSAISVPGMEQAAGMGLGLDDTPSATGESGDSDSGDFASEENANTIRPEQPAGASPEQPAAASPERTAQPSKSVIDVTSSVRDAINQRDQGGAK